MNALATAEAASNERVRQRYFRPEDHKLGLEILRQELLEDRPRRIAISRRIATLLREREANKEALEAASARFSLPPEPAELKATYRGAFGPLKIEVDPEWIREMLPDCSPRSRRGRRLRKLLRLHEEHSLSFGPVARSQASVPWSRRGSGSKRSWQRWQRRLALWMPPGPTTQPYGPLRCSR